MQHHFDPGTVQEGRLRASCDRCHKLKNRCLKTGAADGRCDRCERLDFDCVYRASSRMGRPKGQSKTPTCRLTPAGKTDSHHATSIPTSGTTPETRSTAIETLESITISGDQMEMDEEDSTSPLQQTHESLDKLQQLPRPNHSKNRRTSSPDPNISVPAQEEEPALQLLQLHDQLHRALSTGQPGSENIQAGLDAATNLLGWLQESLGLRNPDTTKHSISAEDRQLRASSVQPVTPRDINIPKPTESQTKGRNPVSFIVVQQVLTCYSCALLILDRVVTTVTSDAWMRAVELATSSGQTDTQEDSHMALRLGGFSLASQPSLNAEVVLHLALRIVQSLSGLIQEFASRCEDLTADAVLAGSAGWHKEFAAKADVPPPIPAGTILHAVSSLVIAKERALIVRLSSLSGGY